jgi:hypothetical protein
VRGVLLLIDLLVLLLHLSHPRVPFNPTPHLSPTPPIHHPHHTFTHTVLNTDVFKEIVASNPLGKLVENNEVRANPNPNPSINA